MIMGKNTLMRAAIKELQTQPEEGEEGHDTWEERPQLAIIKDQLKLNTGLIFSNGDLSKIKELLDANSREAPARVGSIAPDNVTIPAGPTGLDPQQTSYFQNLSIKTKIVRG